MSTLRLRESLRPPPFADVMARVGLLGGSVIGPAAAEVDRDGRFPHEAVDALRAERLLGAYVAPELGGGGLTMTEICRICELLGRYCASTAMVFAMHQIQAAVLQHHARSSAFFRGYLREVAERQLLLASATTEVGSGGDLLSSACAAEVDGGRFRLVKAAPVISYGLEADAILATCRRSPDAAPNDQVLVLVKASDAGLERTGGWDTMGFRGTRSFGFVLRAEGGEEQVVPVPFGEILAHTMHPFSHLVWGSLWLGIAHDAMARARASVLRAMRRGTARGELPAERLVEADELLFQMRSGLYQTVDEYQRLLDRGDPGAFRNYGFTLRVNHVKVTCSERVVEVVGRALRIIGIAGYHNDSESSVCRHLRDAYGAALMVSNDRIRQGSSSLQLLQGRDAG